MDEINRGIEVVRAMKQVMSLVKQNMGQQFKKMDLTGPQGMLMGVLSHYGDMKVSDLSEQLGLSNSTVSGIIDRLEKQGLVERIRSREDRRIVFVSVTPEFKNKMHQHMKEAEKIYEKVMSRATPEEIDVILHALDILKKLLNNEKMMDGE